PNAPGPVAALFAGLLTKVSFYALLRTQTLLFPRDEPWTLMLVLSVATMLVGVLGALAQNDLNRLLSFLLVSHIGFLLYGLAVFDPAGLSGAALYAAHHITVLATLFLVSGLITRRTGTVALDRMDRKSTRLNSSHVKISYAVFCLKKKTVARHTPSTHEASAAPSD